MAKHQRSRSEIAAEYGTQVRDIRPGETEEHYFRSLAKMADQRLVRLEKLAQQENYEGVLSYAYESAMYDVKALSGNPNAKRFNVVTQKTKMGEPNKVILHQKISAVKKFLESPTSKKSTIKSVYEKRTRSINEKFGSDMTWQQAGRFFESSAYEKMLSKGYTSSAIGKAFAAIKKTQKKSDYDKALDQNIRVSEDAVTNEVAGAILSEGLTINDFIK